METSVNQGLPSAYRTTKNTTPTTPTRRLSRLVHFRKVRALGPVIGTL